MKIQQIGAQLYTLRDFLQTEEGVKETLAKVKKIGYDSVQASGLYEIEPEKLKKIADDNGLKIVVSHTNFKYIESAIQAVIKAHKTLDCPYVGIGGLPNEYKESDKTYLAFANIMNELGKQLYEEGLKFVYHNHGFEFFKYNGKRGIDILIENTNPDYVQFEIDTYWVQVGGANPAEYIEKVAGRADVVHFKDMSVSVEQNASKMAEIGNGNLNWEEIVKACDKAGVKYAMVEQDTCERDPFESLAISYNNLKELLS